jgi:hypothetical protein
VSACRECNSQFGASFEAAIHRSVQPMQVVLATNGYAAPKDELAWPKAHRDEDDGVEYDMLPGLRMRPHRATLVPRVEGGYRIVGSDKRAIRKIGEGFTRSGKALYSTEVQSTVRRIPFFPLQFGMHIGSDMRKLAAKCCIALLARSQRSLVVDSKVTRWLSSPLSCDEPDIRLTYFDPPDKVSSFVPAHHICADATSTHGVIGLVRLFDLFTLTIELSKTFAGKDFGVSGRLDLAKLSEAFVEGEPVGVMMPPRLVLRCVMGYAHVRSLQRLDTYAEKELRRLRVRLAPPWPYANLLLRQ